VNIFAETDFGNEGSGKSHGGDPAMHA
jgi:hypothetical protein